LKEQGFRPVNDLVQHSTSRGKVFDGRKRLGKATYFKCVLSSDVIFAAGVDCFGSNKSSTFYAYLLRFRKLPEPKKTAAELQKLINDADQPGDFSALDVPPSSVPPANPNIACLSDEEDGPLVLLSAPSPPPPEQAVPEPIAGPEDAAEMIDAGVAVAEPIADEHVWPAELHGARLTVEAENLDPGHHYFARLKVQCNNPLHLNCRKSRSTQLQTEVFGPRAALYYLGAWLAASDKPESEHRGMRPTVAQIRAYLASRDG
jgi:hypothetical protein